MNRTTQVALCMDVHVCIDVCTHICMDVCTHICMDVRTHNVWMYAHIMFGCMHTWLWVGR